MTNEVVTPNPFKQVDDHEILAFSICRVSPHIEFGKPLAEGRNPVLS
jgi:hypothetical protein